MKVLVVDDSVVYRSAIKAALTASHENYDIDIAANGKIAIDKLKIKEFDIVTLDLEMPIMDGIETIKAIREFNREIPVIIFSAQNMNAANKTLHALELGANDFVKKIEGSSDMESNINMIQEELLPRFRALIRRTPSSTIKKDNPVGGPQTPSAVSPVNATTTSASATTINQLAQFKPDLICIASSTGGPDVLKRVFSGLEKLSVPVLVVQHMPPVFTTQLAKGLDQISNIEVKEAQVGDVLKPGVAYLAPGDFHMTINRSTDGYQIGLNQDPKVCYVRPAADVTFQSVAQCFQGKILAVVFTGMGSDGADGGVALKEKGAKLIIQDEDSSVVWGMPKAIYDRGIQDIILNPTDFIGLVNRMDLR